MSVFITYPPVGWITERFYYRMMTQDNKQLAKTLVLMLAQFKEFICFHIEDN